MALITIDEESLRERLIAMSPQLRQEHEHIAGLLRELVNLERQKMGLDHPGGKLWLYPNQEKKNDTDPDLIGKGLVNARPYQAAGWVTKSKKLKIALLPPRRHD